MTPKAVVGKVRLATGPGETRIDDAIYALSTIDYPRTIVIDCQSCRRDFVVVISTTGKTEEVWPLSIPAIPEGVPEKVGEAYRDARLSLAAGAKLSALLAGRTVLTRILTDKAASSLKELSEQHVITPALYGGADQLRLWANVAGHEDIELGTFSDDEVKDVLDYLEVVLEGIYSHQARVNRFATRTKELKGKQQNNS